MKTYHIKDLLKKEILIIEFPEGYELAGVTNGAIYYYDNQMNYEDYPLSILVDGDYTLLGKPDEIKDEDVKDLVEQSIFTSLYGHYVSGIHVNTYCYKTALESFNSALESEIFWDVNPIEYPKQGSYEALMTTNWEGLNKRFDEAQEKTFDRNRSLILVKN